MDGAQGEAWEREAGQVKVFLQPLVFHHCFLLPSLIKDHNSVGEHIMYKMLLIYPITSFTLVKKEGQKVEVN